MPDVREERTGWRDAAMSKRHRQWGWDCPAVDIDFLMIEYSQGKAVAVVEYKNEHAEKQYASHPSYQAMIDLGNRAALPVFACRYKDDFSEWTVTPLNKFAKRRLQFRRVMTEAQWVTFLYGLRGYPVPVSVITGLETRI